MFFGTSIANFSILKDVFYMSEWVLYFCPKEPLNYSEFPFVTKEMCDGASSDIYTAKVL